MRPTAPLIALPLIALALLTFACRAPEARDDVQAPVELPTRYQAQEDSQSAPAPKTTWWHDFESDELSALVEDVLARNHDLVAAAHRLRAAEAQARVAGAALWPGAGLGGDAARQRQNFIGLPIPGGGSQVLSSTSSTYGVSLNVSWELDLWGKLDARTRAAEADFAAGLAGFHGLRLSLAGQAVKAWLALADARLQHAIATRRVDSLASSAEVVRDRFQLGRVPAFDLSLAEAELASAMARRSAYAQTLARVTRELELLRGGYPAGALPAPDDLPPLPAAVPPGLPAELLRRRPDVLAAEERLRANDYRLYAARKDLWPSLSLTASAGRRSGDLGDLADDAFDVWSLLGNLTQPLFQGGRLDAAIDAADAEVRATVVEYEEAVLRALLEVETALAIDGNLAERDRQLELAAERSESARALAEERYRAGRSDILSVLLAQRQAFESESAWVTTRRERLEQRVDLYLALGGGFELADTSPSPSAEGGDPTSR